MKAPSFPKMAPAYTSSRLFLLTFICFGEISRSYSKDHQNLKVWRDKFRESNMTLPVKEDFEIGTFHLSDSSSRWRVAAGRRGGRKTSSQYFIKYLSRLIMLKMYRKCTDAPFTPFLMIEMLKLCLA